MQKRADENINKSQNKLIFGRIENIIGSRYVSPNGREYFPKKDKLGDKQSPWEKGARIHEKIRLFLSRR